LYNFLQAKTNFSALIPKKGDIMKRALVISGLVLVYAMTTVCFAKAKQADFRLTVKAEEAASVPHDVYKYSISKNRPAKDLLVNKQTVLSNPDIEKVTISKKGGPGSRPNAFVNIYFNPAGTAKLESITKSGIGRQLALVVDNKVIDAPMIVMTMKSGRYAVKTDVFDTDDKAVAFVKDLGFKPVFEKE